VRFATGFNASTATFNVPTPGLLQWTGGTSNGTWTNAGSLTINGSVTPSGIATNNGTIVHLSGNVVEAGSPSFTNSPGANYEIEGNVVLNWSTFKNQGTLRRSSSSGTATIGGAFTNSGGTIDISTGTLDTPGTLSLGAGLLTGSGTLLSPVTATDGFVRPGGLGTAKLSVTGNVSLTKAAELRIELNGLTLGTQYDQLSVTGTVTLGGPLDLVSGYGAQVGDTFLIVDNDGTDAVAGTFAGLPQGSKFYSKGVEYQIDYASGSGNDVRVTVTSLESVIVNTGAAQRSRLTSIELHFATAFDAALLAAPGGAVLTRTGGGPAVTVQTGATGSNGRINLSVSSGFVNDLVLTFDNANGANTSSSVEFGSLADGLWQLHIPSLNYTSPAGSNYFFRLFGDINGDGTVDGGADFSAFGTTFGLSTGDPGYLAAFDFNADGTVEGGTDFAQFGSRFGLSI